MRRLPTLLHLSDTCECEGFRVNGSLSRVRDFGVYDIAAAHSCHVY